MQSLNDLDYAELQDRLVADGLRASQAAGLWRALYRDLDDNPAARVDFSPPLHRWANSTMGTRFVVDSPTVACSIPSGDGVTEKLVLRLNDGKEIESVRIGYPGRYTACLSTQAGCAMGCVFCATGQMGFARQLRPGEIVSQVIQVRRQLRSQGKTGLRNLVLMGMGEPLHNYDAVIKALRIVCDRRGLNIGPSRISISTVGVVPGILRLAGEPEPFNLAVSLHAANDADRSALVPANDRWPLKDLMGACRHYGKSTGRRVFFGWTLIQGRNDSPDHARQVAELLGGLGAHLNLIRLNPTAGFEGQTGGDEATRAFRSILQAAGIPCTIRQFRGVDVAAGCGQLKALRPRPELHPA